MGLARAQRDLPAEGDQLAPVAALRQQPPECDDTVKFPLPSGRHNLWAGVDIELFGPQACRDQSFQHGSP